MLHRGRPLLALPLIVAAIAVLAHPSRVVAASSVDRPLVRALQAELARSMQGLGRDGRTPPYFISYFVSDGWSSRVSASAGVVHDSATWRTRRLDTDVRVGDFQRDNTHRLPT